jgi:nucleotide-binding universal stress UspA family protein
MAGRGTIVVGIDGSDFSRCALEFALEEAVRRNADVRAVWAFPAPEYWVGAYGLSGTVIEDMSGELQRTARETVDAVQRERGGALADVAVDVRAIAGPAAPVLVEQARDADLLVVGHRGRGGFRSAVLGSVGLQCVLHAHCPVTVVRPTADAAEPAELVDAAG